MNKTFFQRKQSGMNIGRRCIRHFGRVLYKYRLITSAFLRSDDEQSGLGISKCINIVDLGVTKVMI